MVTKIFRVKRPVTTSVPPFEEGPAGKPYILHCSLDEWCPNWCSQRLEQEGTQPARACAVSGTRD